MSKTKFQAPLIHKIKTAYVYGFHLWLQLRLASLIKSPWLKPFVRYIENAMRYHQAYTDFWSLSGRERLSPSEIEAMQHRQSLLNTDKYRQKKQASVLSDQALASPETAKMYQTIGILCNQVLEREPLKSVVNVGARVDIVSSFLAGKHPNVQFISVDFQENLSELNNHLDQHPNWTFHPGYPLELLESQQVTADVVLFSSTSVLFSNPELHLYCAAISKFAKYVVFNEPWWPAPQIRSGFRVIRPEEIDLYNSINAGVHGNFLHNYPGILNLHNFEVEFLEIAPIHRDIFYKMQLIAKNKQLSN
jgi:hypothetical protein